ncbi:unnamed protein product, partial [Ilex paraguariensis]
DNRKRKHSSSGAANSTGTGNTMGPSPNSPPSTHTPGDGIPTSSSMQHANSVPKSLMYGAEGTGGLVSSTNHLVHPFKFSCAEFTHSVSRTCASALPI